MGVGEVLHWLLEIGYFDLGSSWLVSKVAVPCSSVANFAAVQMVPALTAPN